MFRRALLTLIFVTTAFIVLFISITQSAQVRYSFNGPSSHEASVLGEKVVVDYHLPYPGSIRPDNPLWSLKAIRDRVWVLVTPKAERRAELDLLFANKRIISASSLFQDQKPELGLTVLTKAEKYLESAFYEEETARRAGVKTNFFLQSLNLASLKHREIIKDIVSIAPEDAKPELIKTEDYAKRIYQESKNALTEIGIEAPQDPFQEN